MKSIFLITACALLLAACSPQTESTDSIESLMANSQRLKEVRAQCKADHAKVGDALCNRAAEATRRLFMGGGTPYAPASIVSPASTSAPKD